MKSRSGWKSSNEAEKTVDCWFIYVGLSRILDRTVGKFVQAMQTV